MAENPSDSIAKQAVADVYSQWPAMHGVAPPEVVMDTLQGDWPKDWRVAVGLLWASLHCPAWSAYRQKWMPTLQNLPSLYLATAEELLELQDDAIQVVVPKTAFEEEGCF